MFRVAASESPKSLRLLGLAAVVCSALTLVGCGGGSRAKDYAPSRMVSFGDENSAFTNVTLKDEIGADIPLVGLAYTVNSVGLLSSPIACSYAGGLTPAPCVTDYGGTFDAETGASIERRGYIRYAVANYPGQSVTFPSTVTVFEKGHDHDTSASLQRTWDRAYICTANNNWVQVVAAAFGFGFPNSCGNRSGAVSHARNGDKVADIVAQVATYRNELGDGVLVTLMGGQNDILEQYDNIKAATDKDAAKAAAINELTARAVQLAGAVNTIVASGAKVIVALTPDLGQSPYAVTENASALLTELTDAFNNTLYIDQIARNQTGRDVAGVNAKPYTDPLTRSTSYVYNAGACDSALTKPFANEVSPPAPTSKPGDLVQYCTSDALVSGTTSAVYMWADAIHLAPVGHGLIGSVAYSRASNQF